MDERIEVVHRFCDAWTAGVTAAELADFFTDDGVYHNMPLAPVVGRSAIEADIARILAAYSSIGIRVLSTAVNDSVVMTERVDDFVLDGRTLELPVMGACEVRDGRIAAWRDYFDAASWRAFMAESGSRPS
jgi:limonene-1,2-epoxide hydrolase